MATPEAIVLDGCAPTPLASYLKALGILRLLSSPANNVGGAAADPRVRGWWEDERFHISTMLTGDEVIRFFLEDYAPSPIIAPWNGGSGFYPKDNKKGFSPLAAEKVGKRFELISSSIRHAIEIVNRSELKKRPEGDVKKAFVGALRSELSDTDIAWLDAALTLSNKGIGFPPLLGTGGNDGRLDFTNNFMQRLVAKPCGLFDSSDGSPSGDAKLLLLSSLFSKAAPRMNSAKIGQFAPGAAGGYNATTGFESDGKLNPWDQVLMLEGAMAFAGAASRRHQSGYGSGTSFPFTVRITGSGWGGVESTDESDRAEFWAPLWSRPVRFCEIESLLGEGRAILNGQTAHDGMEFARAVSSLGVSRGFSEFERFGFLVRAGKSHFATPIGRYLAVPSLGIRFISDLDKGHWMERARQIGRKDGKPAAARQAIKRLEDAIFGLLTPDPTVNQVQAVIAEIGQCVNWLTSNQKARKELSPPPRLSRDWIRQADDGTPEFRIAAALASLGIPPAKPSQKSNGHQSDAAAVSTIPPDDEKQDTGRQFEGVPGIPMAAHFAPIDEKRFFHGAGISQYRTWSPEVPPTVVWGTGSLISNMIAVLERRMVEVAIRPLSDKPLDGGAFASLTDVAAFIEGNFDDTRCAALLAGLIWAVPVSFKKSHPYDDAIVGRPPFAYAVLKTLFSSDDSLRRTKAIDHADRLPLPPGLLAHLRTGGDNRDGRAIDATVRTALLRARASGLVSPFQRAASHGQISSRFGAGVRADRLTASLLIPIGERSLKALLRRAWPDALSDNSFSTEETTHAA